MKYLVLVRTLIEKGPTAGNWKTTMKEYDDATTATEFAELMYKQVSGEVVVSLYEMKMNWN